MKVFLDSGHNYTGADTGATGYGLREQDITYLIAAQLKTELEEQGITVQMSREHITDNCANGAVGASLAHRCNMANAGRADLFVSIHCNAGGGTGTETYAYAYGSEGYQLAQRIQRRCVKKMGLPDRGVKIKPLYVLAHTNMPAVLVETAFIDNGRDAVLLGSREGQLSFAEAMAAGICEHLGIPFETRGKEEWSMTQQALERSVDDLTETVKILTVELENLRHPMIYNYIDDNMPKWARPVVEKLVSRQCLRGDENGLGLTEDMLRILVILDRAGAFDSCAA